MAGKKGRSGRRRKGTVLVRVSLSLDPDTDADLITFFEGIPDGMRPRAVIAALRGGMDKGQQIAASSEDQTAADALDDMLGGWTSF